MQSSSQARQFVQILFIVCLMALIAWLATWQEIPMQLAEHEDKKFNTIPWSEEHLVMPVSAPIQYYASSEHTRAM